MYSTLINTTNTLEFAYIAVFVLSAFHLLLRIRLTYRQEWVLIGYFMFHIALSAADNEVQAELLEAAFLDMSVEGFLWTLVWLRLIAIVLMWALFLYVVVGVLLRNPQRIPRHKS